MLPSLLSTRLHLSQAADADFDSLSAIWSHPDVRRFLFADRPVPRGHVSVLLGSSNAEEGEGLGTWVVRLRGDRDIVGSASLIRASSSARYEPRLAGLVEPTLAIDPSKQRHRFGVETLTLLADYAFGPLAQLQLAATVDAPNEPAIRFTERFGFALLSTVPGPIHQLRTYTLSRAAYAQRSDGRAA